MASKNISTNQNALILLQKGNYNGNSSSSQCYETFFGGNLENLDFPFS